MILSRLSPPARVRVVALPGLPPGGDLVEYAAARPDAGPGDVQWDVLALAAAAPVVPLADLVGGPVLVSMADVVAVTVAWLWGGRFPLARMSLLVGVPGVGKSFLTCDMAARVTTGTPWPDGSPCPIGDVLFITAEDNAGDTIRPRLDACHADVTRVHLLTAVRRVDDETGKPRDVLFTLGDVAVLEQALRQLPECRLVVIDPVGSFLGGDVDAHRDNEVRAVLAPVGALAERYGAAVVVVAHRRKGNAGSADDTALGSRAFTGIVRTAWHLSRDPQDRNRRLLLPGKNNLAAEGDGLAFTLRGEPTASVVWEHGTVAMTADDGMAAERKAEAGGDDEADPEAGSQPAAIEWLRAELADYEQHPVALLRIATRDAGFSWRTVQRARSKLKVIVHRATFGGGFVWRLPQPGTPPPDEPPAEAGGGVPAGPGPPDELPF